jgi:hypothetical protein
MSKEQASKFSSFLAAKNETLSENETDVEEAGVPAVASRRRSLGKRSDPEFEQVTAYIRKNTHRAVKLALLSDGGGLQFSDLVETLLTKWIESRQQAKKLPNI